MSTAKTRSWALIVTLVSFASADTSAQLTSDALFQPPVSRWVSISPSGDWVASVVHEEDSEGLYFRHTSNEAQAVLRSKEGIVGYAWLGPDALLVEFPDGSEHPRIGLRLRVAGDEVEYDAFSLWRHGTLVDPLPHRPGESLWELEWRGQSEVHRVSIDRLARVSLPSGTAVFDESTRVAVLAGLAFSWVADRHGVIRAAIGVVPPEAEQAPADDAPEADEIDLDKAAPESSYILWYREGPNSEWRELRRSSFEEIAWPLSMSADDTNLLVAARAGRDTLGLYPFDAASGELGESLFSNPSADVHDVTFDYSGQELIAAVYKRRGTDVYHYFDSFRERRQRSLEAAFPDEAVHVTSASHDGRYLIAFLSDADNPGTFYRLDTRKNVLVEIGSTLPELDRSQLADTVALEATSADGTRVEAFLTLAPAEEPQPLVVMPHGGPVGIRDDRDFDPLVQYLATAGMAVLKINYRGSAGYGRSFLDAGKREWSKGIEDDVDAAVAKVVARPDIDADRICIAGMSYGGYSALASVIRHQHRYRCAASIAGPTDLPHMFESSDFAHSEAGRDSFAEIVGDPASERDQLIAISPAYSAAQIETPLMIVHGTNDRRVDVDHAYRLMLMLQLSGKDYEWVPLKGADHWLSIEELSTVAVELRGFLARHLDLEIPK